MHKSMATLVAALWAAAMFAQHAPQTIAVARIFPNRGQIGLFVANRDGSNERPLLAAGDIDYDPVWSPDGALIVFTSDRAGSADLYRVKPDGTGLERLTDDIGYDDQAAFSPDSRQLVFVSTRRGGTAKLWKLDLVTRKATPVTSGGGADFRPAWSPNGMSIAFSSERGSGHPFARGRWERLQLTSLFVVRSDGSGRRRIGTAGMMCGSPRWTSDSRHVVAYCMSPEQTLGVRRPVPEPGNDTRLMSIDVENGAPTEIAAGDGVKFNPSPLHETTAFIRKDTNGTGPGVYYTNGERGPRGDIRAASWSPDETRIVFHRRVPAPIPPLVKTFSRDRDFNVVLTGTFLPAFSPDGQAFVSNSRPSPNPFGASLSITKVGAAQPDVVYRDESRNVLAPQWFPNGDRIIFSVGTFNAFFNGFHGRFMKPGDRAEGGAQIAIINRDGSGFREVTSGPNNNAFPSLSPDGTRFVFRTFGPDGYGLRIMDLVTKKVKALTREYDNFPVWSPRGGLIMFARLVDGTYEIYTIRPDGTALRRLTHTHGNDAHMTWSPDGEFIAFVSSRMGFKDEGVYTDAPQPYGELFVMRFDGTHVRQLTDNQWEEGTPAWLPEGSSFASRLAESQQ